MKKILLLMMLAVGISAHAQSDSTKKHLYGYVAGSLSTSTGDKFDFSSYSSLELGLSLRNTTIGAIIGRGSFDFSVDRPENYYYEVKTSAGKQMDAVKVYMLFGWGQYINTTHSFIEYGGGFSYSIKKFDLCIQASMWDNVVYLSPGITYNFRIK